MDRRSFLTSSGITLVVSTAGCVDAITIGNKGNKYKFSIYNISNKKHLFTINITNDPNNSFYQETFDIGASMGEEAVSIDDVPTLIKIHIDNSDEYEFSWPAKISDEGVLTHHANISYDLTHHQKIEILAGQ